MEQSLIYFLHIPKTSGASLIYELDKKLQKPFRNKQNFHNPLESKHTFEHFLKNVTNAEIFAGHYAATPYLYQENIAGFSIVREPLQRLVSCFEFLGPNHNWGSSTRDALSKFVCNRVASGPTIGFNGEPNMQCASLTGDIKWELGDKKPYLEACEYSFSEVLKIIKEQKITLSTLENRGYLLDTVQIAVSNVCKKPIFLDKSTIFNPVNFVNNTTINKDTAYSNLLKSYKFSQETLEENQNLNNLDYQLYNYVKNHEIKTGRCLTPDDILLL